MCSQTRPVCQAIEGTTRPCAELMDAMSKLSVKVLPLTYKQKDLLFTSQIFFDFTFTRIETSKFTPPLARKAAISNTAPCRGEEM